MTEPEAIVSFRSWLVDHGGFFHPHARFTPGPRGHAIIAEEPIPRDATVVSCPFSLAITLSVSKKALLDVLGPGDVESKWDGWTERQFICSYICLHWILGESKAPPSLGHFPYLNILPHPSTFRTSLHFTPDELKSIEGTNLYGATLDRRKTLEAEWVKCQEAFGALSAELTWERYLAASTYLSSRAFPSSLLNPPTPSESPPPPYPVLLPGVDSFNHACPHAVSWVTSPSGSDISLVLHQETTKGSELLNNYGPKPNTELILGYGFSIKNNDHDTMVLKMGGDGGRRLGAWEVGREGAGADVLWREVLKFVSDGKEDGCDEYEHEAEAADLLGSMVCDLFEKVGKIEREGLQMREDVEEMVSHYIEGQSSIMKYLIYYAERREQDAVENARRMGVDLVLVD